MAKYMSIEELAELSLYRLSKLVDGGVWRGAITEAERSTLCNIDTDADRHFAMIDLVYSRQRFRSRRTPLPARHGPMKTGIGAGRTRLCSKTPPTMMPAVQKRLAAMKLKSRPAMVLPVALRRPSAMKLASDDAIGSVAHRLGLLEAMVKKAIAKRPAAKTSMEMEDECLGGIEARVRRLQTVISDL